MMKKILIGAGVIVAALVIFALVLPFFVPVAAFKGRIESQASSMLGRQVTIGDDISLSVLPRIRFHVSDVAVANAPDMTAPVFMRMEDARINVALFPLLSGSLSVEQFVLVRPEIFLERKADGSANWEFTTSGGAPAEDSAPGGETATPGQVKLGDVRIVEGRLEFVDGEANKTYTAEQINVAARLNALDRPFSLNGDLIFEDRPASLDLNVRTLDALMNDRSAEIELDARLDEADVVVDIVTNDGDAQSYAGALSFDVPSLRNFLAWFDAAPDMDNGFGRLRLSGDVTGGQNFVAFENAALSFDQIAGSGNVRADWSGARPALTGELDLDSLDLRPYGPPASETAEGGAGNAAGGAGAPSAPGGEDAIAPWSTAAIDLSPLREFDMNFSVQSANLLIGDIKVGDSALTAILDNGLLNAELTRLSLYDGVGTGTLTLNARPAAPAISAEFNLSGLAAQPFLTDAADIDRVSGVGDLRLALDSAGASEAAIIGNLNGRGSFEVRDGAIVGVNLAQIARQLGAFAEGGLSAAAEAGGEANKTDFAVFSSTFTATRGEIVTDDIELLNPFIRVAGAGVVSLPSQMVDIRLTPRIVESQEGQGGISELGGLGAPMRVRGHFNDPKIGLDTEQVVKDVLTNQIDRLLGADGEETPDGEEPSLEETLTEGLVDALFGKKKKEEGEDQ